MIINNLVYWAGSEDLKINEKATKGRKIMWNGN
jgi:hypothetical protein